MILKYDNHYKCLKRKKIFHDDDYCLLTIRREDIEQIRVWRNSQLDVLRQNKKITVHILRYKHFICIGNCTSVSVIWKLLYKFNIWRTVCNRSNMFTHSNFR